MMQGWHRWVVIQGFQRKGAVLNDVREEEVSY